MFDLSCHHLHSESCRAAEGQQKAAAHASLEPPPCVLSCNVLTLCVCCIAGDWQLASLPTVGAVVGVLALLKLSSILHGWEAKFGFADYDHSER